MESVVLPARTARRSRKTDCLKDCLDICTNRIELRCTSICIGKKSGVASGSKEARLSVMPL